MDHPQFSLKTQCYAILFNLIILSAQPLMICNLVWLLERYQSGRDLNVFFIFLFFLPLGWFIASTILSIISWKIATHRHELIETLSQESFNFFLLIVLCLLAIDTFTVMVIYGLGLIDAPEPMGSVYAAGVFANLVVLMSAFSIVVYASIQIARRNLYHYPCIIRVLK
jgi:uncharacterized Tic20 family protein